MHATLRSTCSGVLYPRQKCVASFRKSLYPRPSKRSCLRWATSEFHLAGLTYSHGTDSAWDEAVALVKRAIKHRKENDEEFVAPAAETPTEIIGEAPAMQEVFRAIGRLSHSNVTVLINGQSGTGKELVARALHSPLCRRRLLALSHWILGQNSASGGLRRKSAPSATGRSPRR